MPNRLYTTEEVYAFKDSWKKWAAYQSYNTLRWCGFTTSQSTYLRSPSHRSLTVLPKIPSDIVDLVSTDPGKFVAMQSIIASIAMEGLGTGGAGGTWPPVSSFTFSNQPPTPIFSIQEESVDASPIEPSEDYYEEPHDYQVKYQDCFGMKDGKVIFARDFVPLGSKIKMYYNLVEESGALSMAKDIEYSNAISFPIPKLGYINYKDHCYLVERQHKRSSPSRYRRGLRADTLSLYCPSHRELHQVGGRDLSNRDSFSIEDATLRLVNSIFNNSYFTYEEALDSVISYKALSAAFNSTMCIRLDSYVNRISLMKNKWLLGYYNPKDDLWELLTPIFNKDLDKLGVKYTC